MHPRLSLDALTSWNWSFDEDLALWEELGVHHVGLQAAKLEPGRPEKLLRLQASGIRTATVSTSCFLLGDPNSWEGTRAGLAAAVDIAVATGGDSVYTTAGRSDGRPWRELLEAFSSAIAPSVIYASQRGVRLAIEPAPRTDVSFVTTLRDAIDVAERSEVAIVVDFGCCWMERDLGEVLQRAAPHIGLVQICDMFIGPLHERGLRGRVLPGEGELPLRRLMAEILDSGYEGFFDLEVAGPSIEAEGYDSVLRRGVELSSTFLTEMGVG